MNRSSQEAGFTLVETLVAFLIISLTAAIALIGISDGNAQDVSARLEHERAANVRSVIALAKAGLQPDRVEGFEGWQIEMALVTSPQIVSEIDAYWLSASHTASGETFRVLIAGARP